jgi:hypothetical protein
VTEEDLARLCWVEVRTTFEADTPEMQNNYVRTLFESSERLLQGTIDRKYEPIEEKLSIYPDRTGQYSST